MQIENLINKSTDTKNTDTKTINDMTAGMRVRLHKDRQQ